MVQRPLVSQQQKTLVAELVRRLIIHLNYPGVPHLLRIGGNKEADNTVICLDRH